MFHMKPQKTQKPPKFQKPEKDYPAEKWTGQPCCIMASGPSLGFDNYADVETIRRSGIKTIAINDTWKNAPFCNVIYAGDNNWWRYNAQFIDIPAERWSCSRSSKIPFQTKYRNTKTKAGYNSGANAIELAHHVFQSPTILLLGFDCSVKFGIHHHGAHKHTSNPTKDRAERWLPQFLDLLRLCPAARIINCSRYTALDCFEKMPLQAALHEIGLGEFAPH